ncbi:MAG: DUF5331 domain-containing protein [Heteroscytonema crispum UTEX LB 1556]
MAFFYSFTDSLKQKWLQFFQANRDWITLQMEVESVYTPDGGKRPSSYLILGVVNALEPKLAQLMLPFSKLNPDADTLIEVLDLHFDPDIAVGNRVIPQTSPEEKADKSINVMEEKLYDEILTIPDINDSGEGKRIEFAMTDSHEQTAMGTDTAPNAFNGLFLGDMAEPEVSNGTQNGYGDISLPQQNGNGDSLQMPSVEAADEFGDISFDQLKDTSNVTVATATVAQQDNQMLEDLGTPAQNAFGDVLSDVWGEETAQKAAADNEMFLGEELSTNAFDDSEIARLFPNM